MTDEVNHPHHYCFGGIECIDAMKACSSREEFLGYLRLTHMKYNWRVNQKHGDPVIDAKKAQWFWDRYVQELKGEQPSSYLP